MPEIRVICQAELSWNDQQWETEEAAYLELWQRCYSLPPEQSIPEWKQRLEQARAQRQARLRALQQATRRASLGAFLAGMLGVLTLITYINHRRRPKDQPN